MSARRLALLAAVLILAASQASAQFWDSLLGSKLEVAVEHPAGLPLKVSTIALAEPEGRCAESILGRIEADFVQNGIAVVDREQLKQVLREQKLQVSGLVDQKTAASVGQLLGAQALVFLRILQCDTAKSTAKYTEKETKKPLVKYITTGTIRGTLRTVDLTTGRVLVAQSLEESGGLESWDAYPDVSQTLGPVENAVAQSVHKMFLPWSEARTVVFYADKECNLKAAYQLLRARDIEGALDQSENNLTACRETPGVKPKTLGHGYYNLGLVQFLRNDHEAAIASLSEAAKLQSGDIVLDVLAESRLAQKRAAAMSGYETDQTATPSNRQASRAVSASKSRAQSLSAQGTALPVEERLQQLEGLKKKGLITQEEYARKRSEILGGI